MKKLADLLTGEKALREKEEGIAKAKKEAIKEEKNRRRKMKIMNINNAERSTN